MDKEIGEVTAVNQKPGKYGVALGQNNWYNGLGTCPAKKGDQVEIEFVVNGQWKNIKDIKVLSTSTDSSSSNSTDIQQMSKLKNLTNARISALTNAVNLAIAEHGKDVNREIVDLYAKDFLSFIQDE